MNVTSLAGLKRYLGSGGAMRLDEYLYHGMPCGHKNLGVVRKPITVQTNAVQFEDGSWLYYGRVSEWEFVEENNVAYAIDDCGFCVLKYALVEG